MEKAWSHLVEDGYLAIYICDTNQYRICEPMNLYIEQKLKGSWIGVVGLMGNRGKATPLWIWKKEKKQKLWKSDIERSLETMYPEYV